MEIVNTHLSFSNFAHDIDERENRLIEGMLQQLFQTIFMQKLVRV